LERNKSVERLREMKKKGGCKYFKETKRVNKRKKGSGIILSLRILRENLRKRKGQKNKIKLGQNRNLFGGKSKLMIDFLELDR